MKKSHLLSITPAFQNFPVAMKFTKIMELYNTSSKLYCLKNVCPFVSLPKMISVNVKMTYFSISVVAMNTAEILIW